MAPDPKPPAEPGRPVVECWLKAAFAKRAELQPLRPEAVLRAVERRLAVERGRPKPGPAGGDAGPGLRPDGAKR